MPKIGILLNLTRNLTKKNQLSNAIDSTTIYVNLKKWYPG